MATPRDGRELGPPLDAHRFDEAALTSYLAANIPGFGDTCEIQQFLGGQSNPTFLIESRSGSYVLRKKPPGDLLPSAHAVDREFRVTSALQDSAVPVAPARLLCEDESVIGQMFYVMDYVPGRVIASPALPDCTPDERDDMYRSMVEVLGALHAVDYRAAGLETFGRPSAYIARQVARWSKQYEASKLEDFEPMENLIENLTRLDPQDERSAIVHGDYRPGNIIFDNDHPHVACVLDWELSTIGHPFADLGYFLMAFHLDADSAISGLQGLDTQSLGIPAQKALLEKYAASAGLDDVPDIDYYIAFSMFRLAAILAGVLKRGVTGNAADPRAVERGRTFKQVASRGWKILQKLP
jgi:aminoglycoside phosphotransferase (APT) family kinase protein